MPAVEGLVVKAHGKKRRQPFDPTGAIACYPTLRVHRSNPRAVFRRDHIPTLIGYAVDLEQHIRIVVRERVNPARPVIFEAACQSHFAAGRQHGGNGVAGEALSGGAFELQLQRLRTVYPLARDRRQSVHHVPDPASAAES